MVQSSGAMYLIKDRNNTYYTRIPLPKALRDSGYPFSVKISLKTKVRSIAVDRNLSTSLFVRRLLPYVYSCASVNQFSAWFHGKVAEFREHSFNSDVIANQATFEGSEILEPSLKVNLSSALAEFIEAKEADQISYRSLNQLNLRINHFIQWSKDIPLSTVTSKIAMNYRNFLINEGRSYKTNHNYLSAINQFLKWCTVMEYIPSNPFTKIKLGQKPSKKKHEERLRWNEEQLCLLFTYLQSRYQITKYSEFKKADLWVPLLCLFSGMRVSEACQLTVDSIIEIDGIKVFNIDSADEYTHLKTDNAYRQIPVHSHLLDLGFLNFIAKQKSRGNKLLFNEKPDDEYGDWSKKISSRFLRILNNLGMKAGNRPTIYGLRHTFIDELQQVDVNENIVAELVGHSKKNITFGRYGKQLNIKLLKEKVELFPKNLINLKIIEKNF